LHAWNDEFNSLCVVGARKYRIPVDGNMAKLRNLKHIKEDPIATKMLSSLKASFARVEGSQEVRSNMRQIIDAYRVFYGQPIMVTFSPNERLSMLVVRLHRVRRNDPCFLSDTGSSLKQWCGVNQPKLVQESLQELGEPTECIATGTVPIQKYKDLPPLQHRERISAQDPLACVYAFNVTCALALKALFGVNVCPDCPNCDCRNCFGSVSTNEGGCFGRVEAYFGSKECQKSGVYIECIHVILQ
jgi:hypothetical protein